MTIFLTTHILSLTEHIADRIGILMGGGLIALGTLEALREQSAVLLQMAMGLPCAI